MKKFLMLSLCAGALGSGAFLFAPSMDAAPKCPNGKDYRYVSRSPEQCAAITFVCEPGSQQFFNECGCGCVKTN